MLLRFVQNMKINKMLHNPNLSIDFPIYRKTKTTKSITTKTQLLACSLIDIMISAMRGNLKRELPSNIFCPCLETIRHLIIYQKLTGQRLHEYNWNDLWACLLSLIRIICAEGRRTSADDDEYTTSREDSINENLLVGEQLILLLNSCITYGPKIFPAINLTKSDPLPSSSTSASLPASPSLPTNPDKLNPPSDPISRSLSYGSFGKAALPLYKTQPLVDIPAYFQLIYQLIHNSKLICSFVTWADHNNHLLKHRLDNVSSVIIHFTAKVDEWCVDHPEESLSADQVMHLIREHYPTLSLASTPELTSDGMVRYKQKGEKRDGLLKAMIFEFRPTISIVPVPESILTTLPAVVAS